jgi:hypothetical protein
LLDCARTPTLKHRNRIDFTLNRGRDGSKYFLKDYNQVLLADAYGGYNGVVAGNQITRAGCWAHWRRKVIDAEKAAPEIARQAIEMVRALYAVEKQANRRSACSIGKSIILPHNACGSFLRRPVFTKSTAVR